MFCFLLGFLRIRSLISQGNPCSLYHISISNKHPCYLVVNQFNLDDFKGHFPFTSFREGSDIIDHTLPSSSILPRAVGFSVEDMPESVHCPISLILKTLFGSRKCVWTSAWHDNLGLDPTPVFTGEEGPPRESLCYGSCGLNAPKPAGMGANVRRGIDWVSLTESWLGSQ